MKMQPSQQPELPGGSLREPLTYCHIVVLLRGLDREILRSRKVFTLKGLSYELSEGETQVCIQPELATPLFLAVVDERTLMIWKLKTLSSRKPKWTRSRN